MRRKSICEDVEKSGMFLRKVHRKNEGKLNGKVIWKRMDNGITRKLLRFCEKHGMFFIRKLYSNEKRPGGYI